MKFALFIVDSIARAIIILFVVVMLLAAATSSILRFYLPNIDKYQEYVIDQINKNNKKSVISVQKIKGDFSSFKPEITLQGVSVKSLKLDQTLYFEKIQIKLNLIQTLLDRKIFVDYIELSNLKLFLYENSAGKWSFSKEEDQDEDEIDLDKLLNRFWSNDELNLKNVQLTLEPYKKSPVSLPTLQVRIQSAKDSKVLVAELMDGNKQISRLILQTTGRPSDDDFFVESYWQMNALQLNKLSSILFKNGNLKKGSLTHQIWMTWKEKKLLVSGKIGVKSVNFESDGKDWAVESLNTSFSGSYDSQVKAFNLRLPNVDMKIGPESYSLEHIIFDYGDAAHLRFKEIDLSRVILLANNLPLPETVKSSLVALSPQGKIVHGHLKINADQSFLLNAEIKDLSAKSFEGTPQVSSVSGFLHATKNDGYLLLDTQNFGLLIPQLYKTPMMFDKAKGFLDWQISEEMIKVAGKNLSLELVAGKAKSAFEITIPRINEQNQPKRLSLAISVENTKAEYRNIFIPYSLSPSLLDWLEKNIHSGDLPKVALIYHGPLASDAKEKKSIQLWFEVNNAEISYMDKWPNVKEIKGEFLLDDEVIIADIKQAKTLNVDIKDAVINLTPEKQTQKLDIDASIDATSKNIMEFLKNQALSEAMNHVMDEWTSLNGSVSGDIKISTLLSKNAPKPLVQVDAIINQVNLNIPKNKIQVNNLTGPISFNLSKGLSSEKMTGQIFGKPLSVKIVSTGESDKLNTQIKFQGQVNAADIGKWSEQPLFHFISGETSYKGEIYFGSLGAGLKISAPLKGIEIDLPYPFQKNESSQKELTVDLPFSGDGAGLHITYDRNNYFHFLFGDSGLSAGKINLGFDDLTYDNRKIVIAGKLDVVEVSQWLDTISKYQKLLEDDDKHKIEQDVIEIPPEPIRLDIKNLAINQLKAFGKTLDKSVVNLKSTAPFMQLDLEQEKVKAALKIYTNEQPMDVHIFKLDVDAFVDDKSIVHNDVDVMSTENADAVNSINKVSEKIIVDESKGALVETQPTAKNQVVEVSDPKDFKPLAINVVIDEVIKNGENFGNWTFKYRTYPDRNALEELYGNVKAMRIESTGGVAPSLSWTLGNNPQTTFNARFAAVDMADVLTAWGYEQEIHSEKAAFDVKGSWQGAPGDFAVNKIKANIKIKLEKGSFADVSNSGTNTLKFLGIFNFNSLIRKLKLDFSDLTNEGLAYEKITGELKVDNGVYNFEEPILIKTPASNMRLTGGFNKNTDQLDMKMGISLPLTSNAPLLLALLAGPAAAAGVYVVNKFLNKQIDKILSVVYSIKGTFAVPEINFDRLFDPGDENEKGAFDFLGISFDELFNTDQEKTNEPVSS